MAVLVERMAAFKVRILALRADIVRRKRIDFRNAGHGSNEG